MPRLCVRILPHPPLVILVSILGVEPSPTRQMSARNGHGLRLWRRVEEACLRAMRWWLMIEEPPLTGRVAEVVG